MRKREKTKEKKKMKDCQEEREILFNTLQKNGWNLRKAAKSLRISLFGLKMLLKRYGIREV